jgi:hypothetical protein
MQRHLESETARRMMGPAEGIKSIAVHIRAFSADSAFIPG